MILESDKLVESINSKEDVEKWVKELCEQFKNDKNYKCTDELCKTCILYKFDNLMKFVTALEMNRKL